MQRNSWWTKFSFSNIKPLDSSDYLQSNVTNPFLETHHGHLWPSLHLRLNLSQTLVLLRRLDHHLPSGGLSGPALHGARSVQPLIWSETHKVGLQCVNAERAIPSCAPSLSRRAGPLPPAQLCSCVCVCLHTVWDLCEEEKSTTPPLKNADEAQRSCGHVAAPPVRICL